MNWSILLVIGSIALFIIIVVVICLIDSKKTKEIMNEGIEADSTVCRVEQKWNSDDHRHYYHTYVKYIGNDNLEHEALLNASGKFPFGRKIRIKYLPPKYDFVLFISQELEQVENNEL